MQAKDLGVFVERQRADVLLDIAERALRRSIVSVELGEAVAVVHDFGAEVAPEHGPDETDILVVSDSSTVVSFGHNIVEGLVGNYFLLFEVHLKLALRSVEIGGHPFVGDVPADGSVLSSLEDSCVEVCEGKQHFLVFARLGAPFVVFFLNVAVSSLQVGFQSSRGLVCQLDSALKNGNREVVTGHRCQPQAVIGMHKAFILLLLDLLEFGHPRG
mmetsp:Transcript_11708/g.17799  ORF Transcript_11708/g.17799 Transcript_11708/m.17799 type:complete len:215 (-) Transcript_11708:6161-6805(-)